MANGALRVRHSIESLQDRYEQGDKKPLQTLMRAWQKIRALPAEDRNSCSAAGTWRAVRTARPSRGESGCLGQHRTMALATGMAARPPFRVEVR